MHKNTTLNTSTLYFGFTLLILSVISTVCLGIEEPSMRAARYRRIGELARKSLKNMIVKKDIIYATVDGIDLKLDFYLPEKGDGPFPLVVWIHGGGWRSGDKANCQALPLLEYGFATASINYRLTDKACFPAQIYDCKAAIRYLRANAKQFNIDPNCIGVWGGSAGGHLAALLGTSNGNHELEGDIGEYTSTSSNVQAVCDWFGPSDFLSMPIGKQQLNQSKDLKIKFLGGSISEKRELAALCSPTTHVSNDDPPFLIMHGDQDKLVPVQQSQLLYDLLKAQGVHAQLIILKGQGHGFRNPETDIIKPVVTFFQQTLKKEKD